MEEQRINNPVLVTLDSECVREEVFACYMWQSLAEGAENQLRKYDVRGIQIEQRESREEYGSVA